MCQRGGGQGEHGPPQIFAVQKAPPAGGGAPHYYVPPLPPPLAHACIIYDEKDKKKWPAGVRHKNLTGTMLAVYGRLKSFTHKL